MGKRSAIASAALTASVRILVLTGVEDLLKREKLDELRAAVAERHGESDSVFFDGQAAGLADVLDELRTYSLLQPYKLVVVDAGDDFVKRHREPMERYAKAPVEQATLVLRSIKWNPGNLDKLIAKVGVICKCEPCEPAQAQQWVLRRCPSHHGRAIAPAAAEALVERVGTGLAALDSELGKLSVAGQLDQPIELADVEQLTGRGSDESAFAIQQAVLTILMSPALRGSPARTAAMLTKLHEIIDLAGNDAVPVTYALNDFTRKLAMAHLMKKQGEPEFQIARELKFWGLQADAIWSLLGRLGAQGSQRWFDRAMEMDRRGKSGGGEPIRNLECFCALMADEI